MSASLVGSEMCIRDSTGPLPQPGAARRRARWPAACCRERAGRSPPVSYTHLTLPTICSV
eukprot:14807345-Alexandrium_andersonii.AAC.1